jgi:hemolysin III
MQLKEQKIIWPFIIYLISLNLLFLVSTLYHRPNWSEVWRMWMRRFDHAAIYLLIAGTGTPIFFILMDKSVGIKLMYASWLSALAGIIFSLIWVKAPKWLNSLVYMVAGFSILPYMNSFIFALSDYQLYLFFSGALIYITGAIIYALKSPNLYKKIFGYHELFHILVVIGAFLHFLMIYDLL